VTALHRFHEVLFLAASFSTSLLFFLPPLFSRVSPSSCLWFARSLAPRSSVEHFKTPSSTEFDGK
jgi:hypothetical protein